MKYLITALALLPTILSASDMDYHLTDGQFYTSEGKVPAGCFAQLMTELNGDNLIAAIYLNRAQLRGCIKSNYPYPDKPIRINYQVIESMPNHVYRIKVCQRWDEGTLRGTCSGVYTQFLNRSYRMYDGSMKQVLSIEKVGEWSLY